MPYYMYQVSYTPEAWKALVRFPQNRMDAVRPVIERLGGKIEGFWMTFGEFDAIGICQMPSNVNAAAFSMAALSGGAVREFRTTPLMSIDEGMEAMRRSGDLGYQPPSE